MPKSDDNGTIKCSFCGKSQDDVEKLIAGPGVCICDECIELCMEIVEDGAPATRGKKREANSVKPKNL